MVGVWVKENKRSRRLEEDNVGLSLLGCLAHGFDLKIRSNFPLFKLELFATEIGGFT